MVNLIIRNQLETLTIIITKILDVEILNLNLFRKPLLLTPASPEVRGSIFL